MIAGKRPREAGHSQTISGNGEDRPGRRQREEAAATEGGLSLGDTHPRTAWYGNRGTGGAHDLKYSTDLSPIIGSEHEYSLPIIGIRDSTEERTPTPAARP